MSWELEVRYLERHLERYLERYRLMFIAARGGQAPGKGPRVTPFLALLTGVRASILARGVWALHSTAVSGWDRVSRSLIALNWPHKGDL